MFCEDRLKIAQRECVNNCGLVQVRPSGRAPVGHLCPVVDQAHAEAHHQFTRANPAQLVSSVGFVPEITPVLA
jgi:hypothetical protein